MPLLLLLAFTAQGSSLDNLEIGGPFGTPATTDPTAAWWNPAGLAAGAGTRLHLEVAPMIAGVDVERSDPYGYGTADHYSLFGIVPYLGVASDLTVDGLGVGLALAVPGTRGGVLRDEIDVLGSYTGPVPPTESSSRYAMREGHTQTLHVIAAASYEIMDRVALGAGVALVDSSWSARLDTEALTALDVAIAELGQSSGYTDDMVEDPRYGSTLEFDTLKDNTVSWSAGLRVVAVPDRVVLAVSHVHGYRLRHTGDVALSFGCPPQDDTLGRFGAESYGVCNVDLDADAKVAYDMPSRWSLGLQLHPSEHLAVELMGGWIGWSAFTDFDITVSGFEERNELQKPAAADLVNQRRQWARANRDTGWGGVDVKGELGEQWLVGGRVLYDRAAVPNEAVLANNYDADTLLLSGLVAYRPLPALQVGLSFTHHLMPTRTITNSAFGVTLEDQVEDRWFYPHGNGTYRASIERIGLVVRTSFGE